VMDFIEGDDLGALLRRRLNERGWGQSGAEAIRSARRSRRRFRVS
jgi:hypothetical protein